MAYIRRRGCKCPKDQKRCSCGAKWSFTVDIGLDPVTGKRRQITRSGFDTRREAEIAAARIETEVADGTYIKESGSLFEEYAEIWLKTYRMSGVKESSIRQREFQVKTLLKYFAKIKLPNITRKMYRNAILDLSSKWKRNTVIGVHTTAKSIFRMALEDGDIKSDPTEFVKVPGPQPSETKALPKYMEKEQLAEFLRLAKTRGLDQDFEIFFTMAYTGIRVGEACVLKWSDIDFENGTISINGTLYNPLDLSDWYEILTPKTTGSRRTIEVDETVLRVLQAHKARQNEFKMLHRNNYHDADFVFGRMDKPVNSPPRYGYPLTRRTVQLRMQRLIQWMKLPTRLTPHSLRHTHTSLLAEAGVSLEAIMDRLGHKDDRTTRLIYLHVTKKVKKEAAERFADYMSDVVNMWSNKK